MNEIRPATPDETLLYIMPVIREAQRLNLQHDILEDMVIIRRPKYIPRSYSIEKDN